MVFSFGRVGGRRLEARVEKLDIIRCWWGVANLKSVLPVSRALLGPTPVAAVVSARQSTQLVEALLINLLATKS